MSDEKFNRAAELDSPAWSAAAVSPNDSTDLSRVPTRGLYIGGAGDVEVNMAGAGSAIVFAGVLAGTILPIRVDRVLNGNTDATNIVALY